ncbi:UNKNOWN [Stylonychia lemnae]|uniref:Uncharacterized protein n=1 Tax=Stylonychia lemnae TaxID=5949 RepID=A0A078A3T1_STYLE|nr:UNKNOWN [Stylonychia lemnae]|eukprot:CDW76827.1 UNKNOWN [Stylonychia lemnae]
MRSSLFKIEELQAMKYDGQIVREFITKITKLQDPQHSTLNNFISAINKAVAIKCLDLDAQQWKELQDYIITKENQYKQNPKDQSALNIKQICILSNAITKAPNLSLIQKPIILALFQRLMQEEFYLKKVNQIDLEQMTSFLTFVEQNFKQSIDTDQCWMKIEKFIINELKNEAFLPRNVSNICMRFSQNNKGTKQFWQAMNSKFDAIDPRTSIMDLCTVLLSFSKANWLNEKAFIEIVLKKFEYQFILNPEYKVSIKDIAQLLTTAKHQDIQNGRSLLETKFWELMIKLLKDSFQNDKDQMNKQTYMLILSSIWKNIDRKANALLYKHLDQYLYQIVEQMKQLLVKDIFTILNVYNSFAPDTLSAGVKMILVELLRETINSNLNNFQPIDLCNAFGLLQFKNEDQKYMTIVIDQIIAKFDQMKEIDIQYILNTYNKIEQSSISNAELEQNFEKLGKLLRDRNCLLNLKTSSD